MALALSKRLGGLSMAAPPSSDTALPATGLLLIGMGMGTVEGMTVEATVAATAADRRYYEAYTALWPPEELARLESVVGPIERVMRPEVEQPEALFELARKELVALLVVGDPLQATTHVDLQLRAAEEGLACHVIHGISITTTVTGAVGLSNYKFGRQTTLTYPYGDWIATSPLEVLALNWEQNLHTLALLDLDPTGQGTGDQRPMRPADAVRSVELMWDKANRSEEQGQRPSLRAYLDQAMDALPVVLCSDMGTPQQAIVSTALGKLAQEEGGRLNCLVFPAGTSEVEGKALLRWQRGE
jgi:diphthine synthase